VTDLLFTQTDLQNALQLVASETGTSVQRISITLDCYDGAWMWTVRSHVATFKTPTGKRRGPDLAVSGFAADPVTAACACINDIARAVTGGREITHGGRIEILA
jgi:hypothetical protein